MYRRCSSRLRINGRELKLLIYKVQKHSAAATHILRPLFAFINTYTHMYKDEHVCTHSLKTGLSWVCTFWAVRPVLVLGDSIRGSDKWEIGREVGGSDLGVVFFIDEGVWRNLVI